MVLQHILREEKEDALQRNNRRKWSQSREKSYFISFELLLSPDFSSVFQRTFSLLKEERMMQQQRNVFQ